MNFKRSESILLVGEAFSNPSHPVAMSFSEDPSTEIVIGDLGNAESGGIVVLVPSDEDETRDMRGRLPAVLRDRSIIPVLIGGVPGWEPLDGLHLRSSECDYSLRVIACLSGCLHLVGCQDGSMMVPVWMNVGSLLPFFVHNVNNILARVLGNAELALMYIADQKTAGEKLASALKGVEDLRGFIQDLTELSTSGDKLSPWSGDTVSDLEGMFRLFCGRAVNFNLETAPDAPGSLKASQGSVDTALGLSAAAAAIMVNGSGEITLEISSLEGFGRFDMTWSSHQQRTGLVSNSLEASSMLMSMAAACCYGSGLFMDLGEWSGAEGKVSILVPR